MPEIPDGHLFLGHGTDPATHERDGSTTLLEASDLVTHGVIVGMTGSGKTGLGVILLEEALLAGIPTLILDPKGDMGNLLLTFPELAAGDFAPWIDEIDAARRGQTVEQRAADVAAAWREGLGRSGIGGDRIALLRSRSEATIYTPGSTAGVPLDLVGGLRRPPPDADDETVQEEVESAVSSILGLVGIDSDPLSGREHILIANLIARAWQEGRDIGLAELVAAVQEPPMRKLGVIDLDTFFPPRDRTELALRLNGLIASPAFASWSAGVPLDMGSLLGSHDGRARAAIVSMAHLSDEERQFVVTLVLAKLITWMRAQPGTSELRALVYMDEVFGFVPPTAAPPSKKPILTILKQARAHGVGMVLATQNPVDVDYKALSNAGTWMVGRLQTERDKGRLLEGMTSAGGETDVSVVDRTISGLDSREFLLHSTRRAEPSTFTTRWAMSYLRGPLTRDHIAALTEPAPTSPAGASGQPVQPAAVAAETTTAPPVDLADDESAVAPTVADDVAVWYLDPAAPFADSLGSVAGGRRLRAAVVARVRMLFDDTRAGVRHQEEWEAILPEASDALDPAEAVAVDYDDRDLREQAPEGAVYVLPTGKIHTKTYFRSASTALRDHVWRNRSLEVLHNPHLKLFSRVGETPEDFALRCRLAADEEEDREADKLRAALEKRMDRVRAAIAKAEDRVDELNETKNGRRTQELIAGAGAILAGLLGGRRSARGMATDIRGASSRRTRSREAGRRLESAENRLAEKIDELEELEEQLAEELLEIDERWTGLAEEVETKQIALEKTDVTVAEIGLLWIPTA